MTGCRGRFVSPFGDDDAWIQPSRRLIHLPPEAPRAFAKYLSDACPREEVGPGKDEREPFPHNRVLARLSPRGSLLDSVRVVKDEKSTGPHHSMKPPERPPDVLDVV